MPATVVDRRNFGIVHSTEAMRRACSDENRTAQHIGVEHAPAILKRRIRRIPREAAAKMFRACDSGRFDLNELCAQTRRIGYPILAAVERRRERLAQPNPAHAGATSREPRCRSRSANGLCWL